MKICKYTVFPLLTGLLLMTACQTGPSLPRETRDSIENEAKFVLLDSHLDDVITCTGLQEGRTAEGFLEVIAHVKNRLARREAVEINCEFKNAQGFSTGQSIPFGTMAFSANEQRDVKFTSTTPDAQTYTIRVRKERQ